MTAEQLPTYFYPLFAATVSANACYVGSLFLLQQRLAGTPHAFKFFGGSPMEGLKALGFVFSGQHSGLNDDGASRLVWLVRVLFVIGLVGTLTVFAVIGGDV